MDFDYKNGDRFVIKKGRYTGIEQKDHFRTAGPIKDVQLVKVPLLDTALLHQY